MSDIPIGSPPVPPGRHAAPGGWYPDPVDPAQERYWDGWQWTRSTRPGSPPVDQPAGWPPPERRPGPTPTTYGHPPSQSASGPAGYGPGGYGAYGAGPAPGSYAPGPYAPSGPTTADGVPLAGWWWRVLATLIDGVFVGLLALVPTLPFLIRMTQWAAETFRSVVEQAQTGGAPPIPADPFSPVELLAYTAISLGVAAAYHLFFLRTRSATPGKLIVGLRVVPVDRGRSPDRLPWQTVGIRTAVWLLPGLSGAHPALSVLGLFRLLDVLFPLWQPRRQTIHDLAAKTQVVRPVR